MKKVEIQNEVGLHHIIHTVDVDVSLFCIINNKYNIIQQCVL